MSTNIDVEMITIWAVDHLHFKQRKELLGFHYLVDKGMILDYYLLKQPYWTLSSILYADLSRIMVLIMSKKIKEYNVVDIAGKKSDLK